MKKQVLKTINLTKKYKDFSALNNVSINVDKGDIYGLIGKNGAGKTTLFKLIMGLSKITSGDILINDNTNLDESRRKIGFMIGLSFFPYLNAYQNLEHYRIMKGIKDKKEIERVLRIVDLWGVKKPFKTFSMGMKQRLGIANALLGNPEIVILDEPINGLDPDGIKEIRKMIKKINEKDKTTFIISSHILSELDLIANKFGFIDHGILVEEIKYDALHKQTSKSLIIEVDDIKKCCNIIEVKLKTQKYIIDEKCIILNDYLDEADKVSKAIIDNGLKLYTIKKQETTLEEYFMNLVGGNE